MIQRLIGYAKAEPERDAIVTPTLCLSFAELAMQVRSQAQRLGDAGISPDSVVAIRCSDDTQHLLICLATIELGATSFTVPSHESRNAQQSLIQQCDATHVVDELTVDVVLPHANVSEMPVDAARLLFSTSGTTGKPKIVIHHDTDLVAQAHRHVGSMQERFVCLASMEHNFAKRHRLYCVAAGACNVFLDSDYASLVDQCLSLNVNVIHVSAFQAQELLAVPDIGRLSAVRLKLGGSHVPLELRQQLRDRVTHKLQAGYGTTETGAIGFTDPDDSHAGESVGQALPGIEIRAVAADRTALGTGERGELAIRCDGMFRGYLGRSGLTSDRLVNGWFYTGDIGYLDDEQRIHLCGRSDDMFMFNSTNIYPQDIESRISRFPGILEALVLPKPSAVHGNIPVAFVVCDPEQAPDLIALKAFIQEQVGIRSPRQFVCVESLPRNASGKVSRHDALNLAAKSDQIRSAITGALGAESIKRLKPATIAAFENGDIDIPIRGIALDSFARIELLVMLELEYDVIITPEEFSRFTSLGDISARVLTPPAKSKLATVTPTLAPDACAAVSLTDAETYLVRFTRRVVSSCHTVAQFHKALGTLEHRLTPLEIVFLHEQDARGQLLPSGTAEKFQFALSAWLRRMDQLMLASGKQQPEPFESRRIAPAASYFFGPGATTDKTLLVCFANKGGRQLSIPNAALLQHTDSAQYDLLVIAEPLRQSFLLGVPLLGRNIDEVVEWIRKLEMFSRYRTIRTIGCSAGAYMAVIAGYGLGAELAVSVAGRFHAERHVHRILGRVFATWRTTRRGHCGGVLMSYPADKGKSRDRIYAQIMAKLTGGNLLGVTIKDEIVGHLILRRLLERGELAPYLARTIFAAPDDEIISCDQTSRIFSLPGATTHQP